MKSAFMTSELESPSSMQIPKRIVQTANLPPDSLRQQGMVTNVRLLHREFDYVFYDRDAREEFIDREFPQYRQVYDAFQHPIQRIDFFRYLEIYHHGGFYLDLDVLLARSLSALLNTGCVFPFERLTVSHLLRYDLNMDWEVGNYAFGATPGHPFLDAVIRNCIRSQKEPRWAEMLLRGVPPLSRSEYRILSSTGPTMVSRTLAENPELAKSVIILFAEDVCEKENWFRLGDFGVHLMDGAWRGTRGRFRARLEQAWMEWRRSRAMKHSRAQGPTRSIHAEVGEPSGLNQTDCLPVCEVQHTARSDRS